jgi:hypothetical protein
MSLTDVAHGNASLFEPRVNQLDQVAASVFGEGGQVQPNSRTIIVGREAKF